jgi:hypothetical protein
MAGAGGEAGASPAKGTGAPVHSRSVIWIHKRSVLASRPGTRREGAEGWRPNEPGEDSSDRGVGNILKYTEDDDRVQPRYSYYM